MCDDLKVPFLGSLPIDPVIARYCDEGKDFINEFPESSSVKVLNEIAESKYTSNILIVNYVYLYVVLGIVAICDG